MFHLGIVRISLVDGEKTHLKPPNHLGVFWCRDTIILNKLGMACSKKKTPVTPMITATPWFKRSTYNHFVRINVVLSSAHCSVRTSSVSSDCGSRNVPANPPKIVCTQATWEYNSTTMGTYVYTNNLTRAPIAHNSLPNSWFSLSIWAMGYGHSWLKVSIPLPHRHRKNIWAHTFLDSTFHPMQLPMSSYSFDVSGFLLFHPQFCWLFSRFAAG